jgi:HlyD family secretion protein
MTDGWPVKGPVLIGVATLFLLVICFGGWSVLTTITGAILASGTIEVEQNRQIVQHPDGGVVASIHVTEAQTVKAGDLLLRLDGAALLSELRIVEGLYYETLARQARLEAERDDARTITFAAALQNPGPDTAAQLEGQRRLFAARRETQTQHLAQLAKRRSQIESQITGIDAQSQAIRQQLDLIQQELATQQDLLSKGLTQVGRVLGFQRETARLGGQAGELAAARAQSESRVTEIEVEILSRAALRREEAHHDLRDTSYRALELAERRRALTEKVARLDIKAPVSGIVLGLRVTTPRAVLRPADPVLYLVPQNRPLVIAAHIPPHHIDQIRIGQSVKLVFSAFPSRTTPELTGHVTVISADILTDERTQARYYRAEISTDVDELSKLDGLTLIPGMPVDAFITTDTRTPLAYLLKPFTDYFKRAFRET